MPAFLRRLDRWAARYWWAIPAALVAASAGVVVAVLQSRGPTPAPAVEPSPSACRFGPDGVVDVTVRGDGETTHVATGPRGAILVNRRPCGDATVRTAEALVVEGGSGTQTVILDLSGGPFAAEDAGPLSLTVDLGAGDDTLIVEAGDDGAALSAGAEGLRLDAKREGAEPDLTLRGVDRLRLAGGDGDDVLTGTPEEGEPWPGGLTLEGGPGDDVLVGGPGEDILRGGPGDDRLTAGQGDDLLDGGEGQDTVDLSALGSGVDADLVAGVARKGRAGRDVLRDVEQLVGGAGDDVLRGDDEDNRLEGGPGDDVLIGRGGDDVLDGGPGTDVADYGATTVGVRVDLRAGKASGEGADSLTDVERILGGSGDDELRGDGGPNVLDGGAGDDLVEGRGGADRLVGGSGADVLSGGPGDDVLRGGAGPDSLRGGRGDDLLEGGHGNDRLQGGPGIDTLDYTASPAGIRVNLGAGRAGDDGFGGADTVAEAENVRGTAGDDVIVGDENENLLQGRDGDDLLGGAGGNDTLRGGRGDDTLRGGRGDDLLEAGPADDVLAGGAGDDILDGGAGIDAADHTGAAGRVVVDLAVGVAFRDGDGGSDDLLSVEDVTGGPGDDVLRGDEGANTLRGGPGRDALAGAGGDDTLHGGPGPDTLRGAPGADLLHGGGGADSLEGGPGADRFHGGSGADTADYARAPAGVEADLSVGRARDGSGAEDALAGIENVVGSRFDDVLIGDDEANVLDGRRGHDRILGLGGADRLLGGRGHDFLAGGLGRDICIGGPGNDELVDCERPARGSGGSARARRG